MSQSFIKKIETFMDFEGAFDLVVRSLMLLHYIVSEKWGKCGLIYIHNIESLAQSVVLVNDATAYKSVHS